LLFPGSALSLLQLYQTTWRTREGAAAQLHCTARLEYSSLDSSRIVIHKKTGAINPKKRKREIDCDGGCD